VWHGVRLAFVSYGLMFAAQRQGSGAAKSGSEARADAVCRRLHPLVGHWSWHRLALGSYLTGLSSPCPAGPHHHASCAPTPPDRRPPTPGPPGAGHRLRHLGVPPRARLASRAACPPALTSCPTGFWGPRRGRQRLDGSPRHRPRRCTPQSPCGPPPGYRASAAHAPRPASAEGLEDLSPPSRWPGRVAHAARYRP